MKFMFFMKKKVEKKKKTEKSDWFSTLWRSICSTHKISGEK